MATEPRFQVGDTYYAASGSIHGRPWDLYDLGRECKTESEANENAAIWLSDLTPGERKFADAWTSRFRVLALDDDGTIGLAESY